MFLVHSLKEMERKRWYRVILIKSPKHNEQLNKHTSLCSDVSSRRSTQQPKKIEIRKCTNATEIVNLTATDNFLKKDEIL